MANLETLKLTINANADSAAKGLSRLIGSLTSLSAKVNTTTSTLKSLNTELERLSKFQSINFSGIENSAKKVRSSVGELGNSVEVPGSKLEALKMKLEGVTESMEKAASKGNKLSTATKRLQQFSLESQIQKELGNTNGTSSVNEEISNGLEETTSKVRSCTGAMSSMSNTAKTTSTSMKEAAQSIKETKNESGKASSGISSFGQGLKNFGESIKKSIPLLSTLQRIMRITSTMMIRTGVRALFKGMKEGLSNYYEYAKASGNEYASSLDSLASSWQTLKNQMGASITPVISAALPVINSLASAATTAFNAVSQLISLLTGKSSWTKATNQVTEFGDAVEDAGSGGGGLNETLAAFDELNVIASESSGGGSGASEAISDFTDMFEEVYEFEEWIRGIADFIKDLFNWITDNLDIVLASIGLIGAAILGWKLSQAFEGALSTIGKLIAGVSLITLGVVLEFDLGTKIGNSLVTGEQLRWEDIAEGVVGLVAAGIGGYVIAGGIGATIGIGISIVALITGIAVGQQQALDKLKWGNTTLTPEEIKSFVKSQFQFDVEAEVTLLSTKLENAQQFKNELDEQVLILQQSINKIRLDIDTSDEAFSDMVDQYEEFRKRFDSWLKGDQELMTAYFQIMPYGEEGAGIMSSTFTADEKLSNYFLEIGSQMADLFSQGMRTQWANNEQEDILALMDYIDDVTNAATEYYNQSKLTFASAEYASNLTKETAIDVVKEQISELEGFKTTSYNSAQALSDSLLQRAAYARAVGLEDEAKQYEENARLILDGWEESYTEKTKGTMDTITNYWIEGLQNVYGDNDYETFIANRTGAGFVKQLKTAFQNSEEEGQQVIIDFMESLTQVNAATFKITDYLNISGWDILTNELKTRFFSTVYGAIGVDAIKQLKGALNISAYEMITISGWEKLTIDQKIEFIDAMMDAYGAADTLLAIKNAGYNIVDILNEGISDGKYTTWTTAKTLMTTVQNAMTSDSIYTPIKNAFLETVNYIKAALSDPEVPEAAEETANKTVAVIKSTATNGNLPTFWSNLANNVRNSIQNSGWDTAARTTAKQTTDAIKETTNEGNVPTFWSNLANNVRNLIQNSGWATAGGKAATDTTNAINDNLKEPTVGITRVGVALTNAFSSWQKVVNRNLEISDITVPTSFGATMLNAVRNASRAAENVFSSMRITIPVTASVSAAVNAVISYPSNDSASVK